MTINFHSFRFARLHHSRKAIALPLTFLILFVSTLGLISITYYFAVEKVNARSQTLKVSTAKQDLISLDENVVSVAWQPGSARTLQIADSGGKLNVQPSIGALAISVSDNGDINETVFNATTGQVTYELPYAESADTGTYLKGDSRAVTNQSGSFITQLSVRTGDEHAELLLRYRPTVSSVEAGVEDGKTVNIVRIYVVNMNSSEAIAFYGKVPLRISCESTQLTTTTFSLGYNPETLLVTSVLEGVTDSVSIPISGTAEGAIIQIEVVQCNVSLERCVR